MRKLAAETAADLVPVREHFRVALRDQPRDALFMPDGHCSDRGYEIIGRSAAAVVARRLRE